MKPWFKVSTIYLIGVVVVVIIIVVIDIGGVAVEAILLLITQM